MKTENQIWADIIAGVKAGIAEKSIIGFGVQKGYQPSKSSISDPTIWIERVTSGRYGSQARRPEVVDESLIENEEYYEEIMIQITARKFRNPATDTVSTQTSGDAMNLLASYFNSQPGIDQLLSLNFNCIKVTDVREPSSISDSDIYEKTPSFDLTLTHVQADIRAVPNVDEGELSVTSI